MIFFSFLSLNIIIYEILSISIYYFNLIAHPNVHFIFIQFKRKLSVFCGSERVEIQEIKYCYDSTFKRNRLQLK